MTVSNLNCAIIQIARVLAADTASRDAARSLGDTEAEFWAGRVAGLAQALNILAVIGEQPVESAKYIASLDPDLAGDALAHTPDLQ